MARLIVKSPYIKCGGGQGAGGYMKYIATRERVEIIPGVAAALRKIHQMGYLAIVVTNQSGVARGMYAESDVMAVHQRIQQLLAAENAAVDAFYYCPHHRDFTGECSCRKPAPGMLLQAAREHDLEPLPICAPQHTTDWIDGAFAVKPTAVITVDEMRGMLFFRAAHERGISIPKTISLLVFNDVTLLSLTTPAISSIQIAAVEMGTLAGKILEKRILDPSYGKGKTYRLPGKLMLRETTAVPGQ